MVKLLRKMVVGFVFDIEETSVLLIHKQRPAWQKGFLNGIGGKLKESESALAAMIRECKEEAGLTIRKWEHYATLRNVRKGWTVYFFVAHYKDLTKAKTTTDEDIRIFQAQHLPRNVMYNLKWLIPLAIAPHVIIPIDVEENGSNG